MTLLVILGAGATFDASRFARGETRPPLARRLFDERREFGEIIARYPQMIALVPRLRAAATDDAISIEAVFEQMVTDANNRLATRRQLAAARFYIHDAIEHSVALFALRAASGVTNYHELVDRIDTAFAGREDVLYVTFNYDQLLERAITDALNHEFDDIEGYVSNTHRLVIKPHGSVNWRRRVARVADPALVAPWTGSDREKNVHWLLSQFETFYPTAEIEVGPPNDYVVMRPVYLPAIAVPTENKTLESFELPGQHMYYLEHWLPGVTQVLVIGWRGRENHFWEMWNRLRQTVKDINVVVVDENEQTAGDVAEYLVTRGISMQARGLSVNGFSGYMAQPGLAGLTNTRPGWEPAPSAPLTP